MGAKVDVQVGIHATIFATREAVVAACTKAAEFLGDRATVTTSSAKVIVRIRPGLVKAMSSVSPVVGINLRPGNNGSIVVDTQVESHRTIQSRMFFIPVGPKRLVGKTSYFNLLTSLERELHSVDSGQGAVERSGAVR